MLAGGWWNDSADEIDNTCQQGWWPEFDSRDPHRKRGLILTRCFLVSHMHHCTCLFYFNKQVPHFGVLPQENSSSFLTFFWSMINWFQLSKSIWGLFASSHLSIWILSPFWYTALKALILTALVLLVLCVGYSKGWFLFKNRWWAKIQIVAYRNSVRFYFSSYPS